MRSIRKILVFELNFKIFQSGLNLQFGHPFFESYLLNQTESSDIHELASNTEYKLTIIDFTVMNPHTKCGLCV